MTDPLNKIRADIVEIGHRIANLSTHIANLLDESDKTIATRLDRGATYVKELESRVQALENRARSR